MGQIERKRQEQEIKRKDILDAAEQVFFLKGYESTSMDELAKAAEFSKRTIYLYFSSKEQIYFEIMIRGYRLLIEMLKNDLRQASPQNALDELHCIFFTFFRFSENLPMYFKAIMEYETKDSASQTGVEDHSKKECYLLGEQLLGYLSHALQRGVEEGSLSSEVSNKKTALILWACTIGIFTTKGKKSDYLKNYHQIDSKDFVTEAFHMLMRLISRNGGNQYENKTGY